MKHNFTSWSEEAWAELQKYIRLKIKLIKWQLYERIGKSISSLLFFLILGLFVLFTLFFLSMTLAFYLGDLWGNRAAGFGAVSLLYITMLLLMVATKKKWMQYLSLQIVINQIENDHDEENLKNK